MLWLDLPTAAQRRPIRCEALLFDMDGTLVDSRDCVERIWRSWCARHRLDADRLLRISHGRQHQDTIRLIAPHLHTAEEIAALVRAAEECRTGVVAVRGAPQLLARLDPRRWAVVTSAWRSLAEIRLRHAGLPLPSVLVTSDEVRRSKPHPESYLAAAARLGVEPAGCVVLEDAPVGIAAARAAGMRVVGVATTFRRAQLNCEWCVDDFSSVIVRQDRRPGPGLTRSRPTDEERRAPQA